MIPYSIHWSKAAVVLVALAFSSGCTLGPESSIKRSEVLLGQAVREPMLVEHPTGALFVAGYSRDEAEASDPPNLFRSDDGGGTWIQVDVGTTEEGARGNSDVDLVVGPDGVLYFLTMGFDRSVGEGTHVSLGISRDIGLTWTWESISETRFDDRPWLALTSESIHVVWNDGSGVRHSVREGEKTWRERERITTSGGSSHFAVGPDGQLAVRIAPGSASAQVVHEDADWIALSMDDGLSWEIIEAPGERDWNEIPRWVEPIGWGPDGTLYSLWSSGHDLWLAVSTDLGKTWSERRVATSEALAYFPFFSIQGDGLMSASWFTGIGDQLEAHVSVLDPGSLGDIVRFSAHFSVDAWVGEGVDRQRDAAGEYFPALFLADGDIAAVLPIQGSEQGDGMSWIRIRP